MIFFAENIFVGFKRKDFFETEEFFSEQSFDKSIFEADGNFCEFKSFNLFVSFIDYQLSFISSENDKTST